MSNSVSSAPVRLSDEQRADFERDGFLVVRGALSGEEVAHYTGIIDGLADDFRGQSNLGADATVEIRNAIARDAGFLPLLDHSQTFPLMLGILGWNIQLTTSHVFVRPSTPDEGASFKAINWHADGPNPRPFRVSTERGEVEPRLYAKIGFFLTDLSQPDRGNLRVVPGSHLRAERPPLDENGEPVGAIQVLTRPGDAVLFENRLWHAVGPNYSDLARKNIYLGYCFRWVKPIDFQTQSDELLAQASPVQRQLLGEASDALSFYLPANFPTDVPLRDWE